MFSFVTHSKMHPALVARIETSIRGKRRAHISKSYRMVAFARLFLVLSVCAAVSGIWLLRQRLRREADALRAEILTHHSQASAALNPAELGNVERAENWLSEAAKAYAGDWVAEELRGKHAFVEVLQRQALYVRAPLDGLNGARSMLANTAMSHKDAFLACLLDPPHASTESALLSKVRTTRLAELEEQSPHVRRLYDAQAGLPFLGTEFRLRALQATDSAELRALQRNFNRAPLERAKQALAAKLLVFVLDEANEPGGITELDGEHAHYIRVGIVDLAHSRSLLRLRRRVAPDWISESKRSEYAHSLDSCLLALDVHKAI